MNVTCKKCSKSFAEGCITCPWCGQPVPTPTHIEVKIPKLPDTPENRAKKLKEYKIIGQDDEWLNGGRFDKTSMENMLNFYARQGWVVKEMASSKIFGFLIGGTNRDEMVIVLERDMFYNE